MEINEYKPKHYETYTVPEFACLLAGIPAFFALLWFVALIEG